MENHLIVTTYCEVLESREPQDRAAAHPRRERDPYWPGVRIVCRRPSGWHRAGCAFRPSALEGRSDRRRSVDARASSDNASACWMGARHRGPHGQSGAGAGGRGEAEREVAAVAGGFPTLRCRPSKPAACCPFNTRARTAVTNIQNSMLLFAAFTQDRTDLLSSALEDRIHQPYRAPLCSTASGDQGTDRRGGHSRRLPERSGSVRCSCFWTRRSRRKRRSRESPPISPSAN